MTLSFSFKTYVCFFPFVLPFLSAKLFFVITKAYYFFSPVTDPEASLIVANLHKTKASGKEIAITCTLHGVYTLPIRLRVYSLFSQPLWVKGEIIYRFLFSPYIYIPMYNDDSTLSENVFMKDFLQM